MTAAKPLRLIYVAHPYGGDPDNLARARRWLRWLWAHWRLERDDCAFVADWIPACEALPESPSNRLYGIAFDVELIWRCDELLLCGGHVSPGMEKELLAARGFGKPITDLTDLGPEPPPIPRRRA